MTYQRRWRTIILAALLVAMMSVPAQVLAENEKAEKATASAEAAPVEKPANVANVNGKMISYEDFTRQMEIMKQRVLKGRPGQLPEPLMQQMQTQVVKQMVAEELLFQESQKKGIKIESKMIDAELKNLKQRFGTDDQYQQILKQMKITEERLKDQILHQASIRKLVDAEIASKIKVEDANVRKYFEDNTEKFKRPERVRAQHILIKVAKEDDDQKKVAARKKLEDIKKKIMGGEDFGQLAKDNSEGPSNTRGGDLGYFTRGRMVKSFEEVAFKLAPNEVSDIVETQFGYHLIKVMDHQQAQASTFDEVKAQIKNILHREQVQKQLEPFIDGLRGKAKVETYLK